MFDRFAICNAYYVFAILYNNGGDTSDGIMTRLENLNYSPSWSIKEKGLLALNDEELAIFAHLEENHPDAKGCTPSVEYNEALNSYLVIA